VAGSNRKNVPENATADCQMGVGSAPVKASAQPLKGCISTVTAEPHSAMTISHAAYQTQAILDRRPQHQRADGGTAKERSDYRQYRGRFMSQPQRKLLGADDRVTEPREAGEHHQEKRSAPTAQLNA
jgi:hypothetical protein